MEVGTIGIITEDRNEIIIEIKTTLSMPIYNPYNLSHQAFW